MDVTMGSIDETATELTHDETFTKIHHQLVLYVKEKEQIDDLRHTQAKLAEVTESLKLLPFLVKDNGEKTMAIGRNSPIPRRNGEKLKPFTSF